jgi:OmpA-OmpF porin, OOP family
MDLRKAICASLLCALTGAAMADEKQGFTFGAGIGKSDLDDGDSGFDGDDTGFKLFGGYQITSNFSAELAYIDGGTVEDTINGLNVEADTSAFQASIIGTLPVNEQFSVYGRTGFLQWDADLSASNGASASNDGTDFAYGLGASLALPKTTLRLEYEASDLDGTDFTLISLSAVFSF